MSTTWGDGQLRPHMSAQAMDQKRQEDVAYEYLCHLEEARMWMGRCLEEELPPATELEPALTNGVILAKLSHFFAPTVVNKKKIYDTDLEKFKATGLHFKHTDNINFWLKAMKSEGLPSIFYPTTTDIYNRKNIPKTIYCLHALSIYLHRLGKAPAMQDLLGQAKFTEEEISNMQRELDKHGIQMPAFGKIGGILAGELSVDEAAVHAAVLVINEALEKEDASELVEKLNNPAAGLHGVVKSNGGVYLTRMKAAKKAKIEKTDGKLEADLDAYDRLLTRDEIEKNLEGINKEVKITNALSAVNDAMSGKNADQLVAALSDGIFASAGVNPENVSYYLAALAKAGGPPYTQDQIRAAIAEANVTASQERHDAQVLADVAAAAASRDGDTLLAALADALFASAGVQAGNAAFYLNALAEMDGPPYTADQIRSAIEKGNLFAARKRHVAQVLAFVSEAVSSTDVDKLNSALGDNLFAGAGARPDNATFYIDALSKMGGPKYSVDEIKAAIAEGNTIASGERHVAAVLASVADTVSTKDGAKLLAALADTLFAGAGVQADNASFYINALSNMDGPPYTQDQIRAAIEKGNSVAAQERHDSAVLTSVCDAVSGKDGAKLLAALDDSLFAGVGSQAENASYYLGALAKMDGPPYTQDQIRAAVEEGNRAAAHDTHVAQVLSDVGDAVSGKDGAKLLAALADDLFAGVIVQEDLASYYLAALAKMDGPPYTKDQIASAVEEGNRVAAQEKHVAKVLASIGDTVANQDGDKLIAALADDIFASANVQAADATFYLKALAKVDGELTVPLVIDALAQGCKDADNHRIVCKRMRVVAEAVKEKDGAAFMAALEDPLFSDIHVKEDNVSFYFTALEKYGMDLTLEDLRAACDIDFMAENSAEDGGKQAQISSLQKFLHLLEANERDYEEEKEIQRIKQSVVSTIRHQQELEENLNIMDIKIGLLVKNRLDLDDVVHQQTKLKKKNALGGPSKGLKSLSKESRAKLEGYQHLFYSLQTNPSYLARLIFQMPGGRTTRFIENVIFTLFNYASNQREEYLLMNLFESALKLELKTMDSVEDIAKGNATVIKMVITFNRGARGVSSLKELILPLVNRIINDDNVRINVNPVDVYKTWINQKESETGQSCGMPYDVSTEQALSHPEVMERIMKTVDTLRDITETFVTNLTESFAKIPYGIRYFSMRMRQALSEQFPGSTKADILKVVGNLLYYRFMNPAVVAPDAFDIVELSLDKGLTNEQRRNLGSLAKVLHHASANKLFDGENSALSPLNQVIEQAHQKFLNFFEKASTTEDAESHYNQDKYAEVTQLARPVVYISVKEICNTHKLLLEHEDSITDGQDDVLHRLLKDLGPVPEIHEILGDGYKHPGPSAATDLVNSWEERVAEGGKSEISLTLKSAFDVTGQDDKDSILNIFLQTKRMAAGILQAQPGANLKEILDTKPTQEQSDNYLQIQEQKRDFERKRAVERVDSNQAINTEKPKEGPTKQKNILSLCDVKEGLRCNLAILAKEGLCEVSNNYQAILNSMAKDIRNQHRHRQQRKKELAGLQGTLTALEAKGKYFEDQRESYTIYVDACLSNLTKPKNKKSAIRKTIKYNAAKLHEKGVLLEIEGLSTGQFKGVSFEIESGDTGKFNVYAKFMGVSMDKVELVFEDLLQLQYEGVSVFKMYGCAKINVNLLVFLINKKFYGTT